MNSGAPEEWAVLAPQVIKCVLCVNNILNNLNRIIYSDTFHYDLNSRPRHSTRCSPSTSTMGEGVHGVLDSKWGMKNGVCGIVHDLCMRKSLLRKQIRIDSS